MTLTYYQNYLNCRNFGFIVKLLGHPIFTPIDKLTKKLGIGLYDFSKTLTNAIKDENYKNILPPLTLLSKEKQKELIERFSVREESKAFMDLEFGMKILD